MKTPKKASLETVMKAVNSIGNAVISLNEKVAELPTRQEMEKMKQEILDVVQPIEKAVDKDAVMMVSHEKRIIKIERHLAIK